MKKIDSFKNMYSLSKTLRFSLIPEGKTEENFNLRLLLAEDEKRATEYTKVKNYIDRYHRHYIESVLSKFFLDGVDEYAALYYKPNKTDADVKSMEKSEEAMRKVISKVLQSSQEYKRIFGQDIIKDILPQFLTDREEIESVNMFQNFYTYFQGYNENRRNIYSPEEKSTAIGYRCINENLPKFLDNAVNFEKILSKIPSEIEMLNSDSVGIYGVCASDVFSVDYFSFVLSQSGIDKYNGIIGGYTNNDGSKVKGLNEYINLYNQQVAGKDRKERLPFMKPLYKQILSESDTVSFVPESFESDNEVLLALNAFYVDTVLPILEKCEEIFADFSDYDQSGIFVCNGLPLTELSNGLFGNYNAVFEGWQKEYQAAHPIKSGAGEKYFDKMRAEFKKIKSFSLSEIVGFAKNENTVEDTSEYYKAKVSGAIDEIKSAYENANLLLNSDYENSNNKKLCNNEGAVEKIKTLLDAIKTFEFVLKSLLGTGREENKDDVFYGDFLPVYDELTSVDKLYDRTRNYITKKPYSKDKIKLNFENPQLLSGWDRNKERDFGGVLLRKGGNYYLAIMNKSCNKVFEKVPVSNSDNYEKIVYKQIPNAAKYFSIKQIKPQNPPENILKYLDKGFDKKTMSKEQLSELIKYVVEDFIPNYQPINDENGNCYFDFKIKDYSEYNSWNEFLRDLEPCAYSIRFTDVSAEYIDGLVERGELYLFRIYNKDFSEYSHGNKNLHTMYFEMLFDRRNLSDVVYQLNGGAEIFYRKASIKDSDKVVHPANQPIKNKNTLNPKKESTFEYNLVKDKRFTKRQFSLHLPITLNFKARAREYINPDVRFAVKRADSNYIIGIDRGERNLLYISVINDRGEIIEQKSLNEIISDNGYKVNYHTLLDKKEEERAKARKSWGTVENIKELKEGYLSQVVHEICSLVVKYDAVIAMEDLNFGFKRGRFAVEKQVYQKFENMLITKLNYLVDKRAEPQAHGGLLNAYQLTNKVDGVNRGKQNGIIFYVPAWLTSKIDPVTGFVNLLNTKYKSVAESKAFIEKIDSIRYNAEEDYFEFMINYSNFEKGTQSYKKNWTICSYGERIVTFRNPEKNNMWDNKTVFPTEELKSLFEKFDIDYSGSDIKAAALSQDSKEFFEGFLRSLSNILQMRNSATGTDIDYLISPVKDENGIFFDSRVSDDTLPRDADANGAYNIARKALWAIETLKNTPDDEIATAKLSIKNADWLEYAQK